MEPVPVPLGYNYRIRRDAATPMYTSIITNEQDRLRLASAELGLAIFKALPADRDKNLVYSPCCAAFPLLPLFTIARGETKEEIRRALGMEGLGDDCVHSLYQYAYYRLNQNGRRHDQWRPHGIKVWELHPVYQLLIKRSLLPAADYWHEDKARAFKGYANVLHGVKVFQELDYQAVKKTNDFVTKETKGQFNRAINLANFTEGMSLAMVGAMNYTGTFVNGYRADREMRAMFNVTPAREENVNMMCNETLKEYAETGECQVMGIEYCWGSLTMYIFLPKPDVDLREFEDRMTAEKMVNLLKEAAKDRIHKKYVVKFMIPEFSVRYSCDLSKVFREDLGLATLFDENRIDLNTFLTTNVEKPGPVGVIAHCAMITVEKNIKGELNRFARPLREQIDKYDAEMMVEFNVTRPFFFVVYDVRAQLFLFMGRVVDPSDESDQTKT